MNNHPHNTVMENDFNAIRVVYFQDDSFNQLLCEYSGNLGGRGT